MLIRDLDELLRIAADLRERGRKIVFTNGCYDLLHVGHVRCLTEARALGDCLIVGVNSDDSVRMYKHPALPVQPAYERAEILLALGCVDHVYIFDTPTVDAILDALRPDIYAKGREYTIDTVPERDTLMRYGGVLHGVGDEKTHATSEMIRRIADIERRMSEGASHTREGDSR